MIAASVGVERLVVTPANPVAGTAAVMEDDAALLRRYMLAFDRPSAGSRDRYLYEAWTALPILGSVKVNGHAVHGRRGDVDVVASGPGGRDLTDAELATLRARLLADDVAPEAVAVSVRRAVRVEYVARLSISIPSGPSPEVIRKSVEKTITAEGMFHDLESNVATRASVTRSIATKKNELFKPDMIAVAGNAAWG